MGNAFKSWMPTGLYARALLIMIVPMVILQTVVAFVFMERHWNTVTRRLSAAVVQDIASLIDVYKVYPQDKDARAAAPHRAAPAAGGRFPSRRRHAAARAETVLLAARPDARRCSSAARSRRPFWIDTVGSSNLVEIRIQLDDAGDARVRAAQRRLCLNSEIFIFWMLGTSSILLIVAVLFLRNQIRPILRLADAAESFGKGREAPNFRPRGAREVRRAAQAFLK